MKNLTCFFHKVCEEDDGPYFRKDHVEKLDNVKMTIFEERGNDILYKAFVNEEDFTLVRDQNGKIDVWRIEGDFDKESAIKFMEYWDKLYEKEKSD